MGTHSTIAVLQQDQTVKMIYCHNDGYHEHNGRILLSNYTNNESIDKLISLGALSELGPKIDPDPKYIHNFDSSQEGVCLAYCRDRNEPLDIMQFGNMAEYRKGTFFEEYNYLWMGTEWLAEIGSGDFIPLTKKMTLTEGEFENLPDQKIIDAAPEMLLALQEAYKELEFHNWHNTTTGFKILQAIKLATE